MNSDGFSKALDTKIASLGAQSTLHNFELTGQERLDAVGARLEAMGVGRIHFTYGDRAHLLSEDDLADKKADFLTAFLDGKLERNFMIDAEDDNGWLSPLTKAYNVMFKAGFVDDAKKIEEVIEYLIDKEWKKKHA